MNDNHDQKQWEYAQSMIHEWIKSAQSFWQPPCAGGKPPGSAEHEPGQEYDASRLKQMFASNMKVFQTLLSQGLRPENAESMFKGFQILPEISSRLAQIGMQGAQHLQEQVFERIQKLNSGEGRLEDFRDLDKAFLERWSNWYEKEIRQFFNMPQLGLTRFYQEKVNQAIDKHNQFQAALSQFLHLIYLPVENAIKALQDQLTDMAQKETLPEDTKYYYNQWVKLLEGNYMQLFQSEEYVQCLGKTIHAMNEYVRARRSVLEDALKALPIPTVTDMDELNKEIYELKRRLRVLEKNLINQKN